MDLPAYRAEAEAFATAVDREYYEHLAGHKPSLDIEPIYEFHRSLFERDAVEGLRTLGERELLRFAAEGLVGQATKSIAAELAAREARLELDWDGEPLPLRQASVVQANEPDADRRRELESLRLELVERELTPLLREAHERTSVIVRELGWSSIASFSARLAGIDLDALGRQCTAVLGMSEERYESMVGPLLERQLGFGFESLRSSDLPAFFRAPSLDSAYPAERLIPAYEATVAALGIGAAGIRLDVEPRPTKSPRAFCAPVHVPDEVYLVIAPIGGRDDYEALLHEAGHAHHYANVSRELPFEQRYLGDNSVTEGYAFLLQHLSGDPEWLIRRLGVEDPEPLVAHARAQRLVYIRRYAAKLGYELVLGGRVSIDGLDREYARRLSAALHVDWPRASWLADVDAFFYSARYLRAWAFETHLRRILQERFGPAWFEEREAGELLMSLWRRGQATGADELLAELCGEQLDLSALVSDLA